MDSSRPGSSVYGILQARILEWVAISFSQGIFPIQGWNLSLLHCRQILYQLNWAEAKSNCPFLGGTVREVVPFVSCGFCFVSSEGPRSAPWLT